MTLLIHFDAPGWTEGDGLCFESSELGDAATWYCRWAKQRSRRVFALLPERLKGQYDRILSDRERIPPIWYTEDGVESLPSFRRREKVWVVNGSHLPVVNWDAAQSEVRRNGTDVLVFGGPHEAAARYSESVETDETGEVVRFKRHYDDSPAFADPWSGEASFMVVSNRNALGMVNHVLARGWNLSSVGALTRRLSVRWSSSSCILAPFDPGKAESARGQLASNGGAGKSKDRCYLFFKRLLDVAASAAAIIVLSPLLLVAALLVKCSSRGPLLFVHRRQGLGGKEFPCLKFRSMCHGADAMQAELRGENEVDGPQFKIAADPRLTRVGVWLRRYNIDELPQLINVLLGDMSMVGPRPSPDGENQLCPAWRRARLSVKPGITGLWQVLRRRSRHTSDFQEWIYYDVEYARHRSFRLDLQLLLHTPVTMFAGGRLGGFRKRLARRGICRYAAYLANDDEKAPAES